MPLLTISSNTSIDDPQHLAQQASKLIADMLGKPESYIMVHVKPDQSLIFSGSNEACALVELKSLGLTESSTPDFSNTLCHFMQEQLNINKNRVYIEFSNPERHMWGWDGKTF